MGSGTRASLRDDLRDVVGRLLVGAAAGALAGLVVGGLGGRLAMLVLRLTSPDYVVGMTSDDGFEIGVVSTETANLLLAMAAIGGANGVLYALVRGSIPQRARLALWSLFAAAVGGGSLVHEDGVDFNVLEPTWLAILFFVALPGLAAAAVVLLVERWLPLDLAAERRRAVAVAAVALTGTVACVFAAGVVAVVVVARQAGVAPLAARIGRVVVPLVLVVLGFLNAAELVETTSSLL